MTVLPSSLQPGDVVEFSTRDDRMLATRLPSGEFLCLDGKIRQFNDNDAERLAIKIVKPGMP